MAGFSRINPDVIDLGTTVNAGVTARLRAANRTPFDGTPTSVRWLNATPYIIGNAVIHKGELYNAVANHLSAIGVNDPDSDIYNLQGIGSFWKKVDGKDGDLWIVVNGGSSAIYQKANNVWLGVTSSFGGAITLNDSAVSDLALSYEAALYPSATIEYFIQDLSGNRQRGLMIVVHDGVNAFGAMSNISEIGLDLEIDFSFVVNGSNIEVRYDSGATPTNRTLVYLIRR